MRILWLAAGLFFTALGIIGAFLPVMPTTVFLLVATACFARSSPRLHGWLVNHPTFGPPIRNWNENGAISRGAKRLAIGTMTAVFALSLIIAAQDLRIKPVFLRQHAGGKGFGGVARQDRNAGLSKDRAGIEFGGDQMDRGAGLGIARVERALMGVQAGIFRQERGVDIQHPAREKLHEIRGQDAHEAGKAEDVGLAASSGSSNAASKAGRSPL
jgi:uncharacterized membrane protein YbaN (DUF454 family)